MLLTNDRHLCFSSQTWKSYDYKIKTHSIIWL